jgi:hypothetical protein
MSYGLTLYSVNLDTVAAALGSRDDALFRTICERFHDDLEALAVWFVEDIQDGAVEPVEALGTLLRGDEVDVDGFMYAYALELIICHFGRALDNAAFHPCEETEFLAHVDVALAELGAPADLLTEDLQYGELPFELPEPDDFPGFGHWPASLVATAHAKLGGVAVPTSLDSPVREAVVAVQGWLVEAAGRHEAIVGFYY